MLLPEHPSNELQRLNALQRYDIVDTPPEAEFDEITQLASNICETPVSLITLLDFGRQWFKSKVGLDVAETARKISFCAHAILGDEIFEVQNALEDQRFLHNPLVTGDPNIRFYAGAPLITADGFRLGTLCVIDRIPRALNERQRTALQLLSRQVVRQFEARVVARELAQKSYFQEAVLNSPDLAMISADTKGVIVGFNQAAQTLLGYHADAVIGICTLDFCYERSRLQARATATSTTAGASDAGSFALLVTSVDDVLVGSGEWDYRRKDGGMVAVHVSITPIFDNQGVVMGYLSTVRDVTDRKRAENSHREAQEFIQKIAERVPGMIYQFRRRPDGTSCFPYASSAMQTIYRLDPSQVVNDASSVLAMVHPDDLDNFSESIDVSAMNLSPWRHEYRIQYPDGTIRWCFGDALPERQADGGILWHGVITDVTKQKAAAIALQDSQQFLQTLIDNLPVGIYSKRLRAEDVEQGGVFRIWNHAAERMSGVLAGDVIGRSNVAVFGEEIASVHAVHDRQLLASKAPVTVPVYPFRLPDGSTRLLRMTSLPLFDAAGEVEYSLGIAEDITDLLRRKKELRQRTAELEGVNDASPLGLFRTDQHGAVTYVNRTFENMSGLSGSAALGLGWRQAVHPDDVGKLDHGWAAATSGGYQYDGVHRFIHADRRIVLCHVVATPIVLDGIVTAFVGTIDDITERQAASDIIAASEKRLRTITNNIPALIGYIDAQQRFQFCNTHYNKMFGFDTEKIIGQTLRDVFGEEMFAGMAEHVGAALTGRRVSFERALKVNNCDVFQQVEYVPDIDGDGSVRGFYALVTDVTGRRTAERRLADSEHRLRTITDNLPVAITYIDHDQRICFSNATMHAWTRSLPDAVIGKTVREFVGDETYEEQRVYYEKAFTGERVEYVKKTNAFQQTKYLQSTYIPDLANDGSVKGLFALSHDITALKEIEEELRRLARFDSLTGLPNRAHLHEVLDAALDRSKRNGLSVAVLFLDIDRFKLINDTLGHQKGDLVLQEFAVRLTRAVRVTDTVGRLAGDEFIVILESLKSAHEAELVAEKILEIMRKSWVLNGDKLVVTTSIGVAYDRYHRSSGSDLIACADKSLYDAKSAGRNAFHTRST